MSAEELKLFVPTYNGRLFTHEIERGEVDEFSEPATPVLVREADGLRITLGSHDPRSECTTIDIERQPGGWVILLEPVNEIPVATLYLHDDGSTFFVKDKTGGLVPPLVELGLHEKVPASAAGNS